MPLVWYSDPVNLRAFLLLCVMVPLACDSKETPEQSATAPANSEAAKPVDTKKQAAAKMAKDAIEDAPAEMQATLATAAVLEADKAALPASLAEGLEAITHAPADRRAVLLARSLSENLGLLREACGPDAETLMKSLASMDPSSRSNALWKGCNLERHGLISPSDRGTLDPLMTLISHMVFLHTGKTRTLSKEEQSLLRSMMLKGETRP